MKNKKIPIVMISDDNFVMQTCVTITSLYKNKHKDTVCDIFIVMAECSEQSEMFFQKLEREDCTISLIHASLEKYKDIKQLAHIPIACLLKFDICELISEYEKLLYLDGDIIIRKDLSELYDIDLDDNYVAAVKELYCMKDDDGCINAGVMLFNAKKMRKDGMRDILVAKRKELGDRSSMDQQTYNVVIKNHIKYLSVAYNCVPGRLMGDTKIDYTLQELNNLYNTEYSSVKQLIREAVIIHFATGNKPWKYTFAPCAKEWYKYYLLSPYGNIPFKRYGKWGYRFHHMKELFQKEGLSGVIGYLKNRKNEKGKGKKAVDWD